MKSNSNKKTVVDPVCGMTVDPEKTKIKAVIEGQNFYFCAEGCRIAFEKNPAKYLEPECEKPKGLWGRYMARLQKATGGRQMKCH